MADQMDEAVATRLHSASIRLLRLLRREDEEAGMSGPRLSTLSVIVFGGPVSLAELAAAEQVRAPTMSRIVDALVEAGMVTRTTLSTDRRKVRIAATEGGEQLLKAGQQRRVKALAERLGRLAESERRALARGVEILERAVK